MVSEVKIIISFWPKTMDYVWELKKMFEETIAPYRKRKEKSNATCFSCTAHSSREL